MAKIKEIRAFEILDSKGNPTIETTVFLSDKTIGTASVPSGTSTGSYEAVELRDRDPNRFQGLGVSKAIEIIHKVIAPRLIGLEATNQHQIDRVMIDLDGTQNKSRMGANAILSVSMAVCKASAQSAVLPLFLYLRQFVKKENAPMKIPSLAFNMINGAAHANNGLDFQEFLVVTATSKTYSQSLQMGTTIYHSLKELLRQNGLQTAVGDEGGFAPSVKTNEEALSLIREAIDSTSIRLNFDVFLGLDAASNSFYQNRQYHIKDKQNSLSAKELISFYSELNSKYHLLYLEDPLAEDDWENWPFISSEMSQNTIVAGDDLIATNPYRLQMALDKKAISAVIVKPNQIGTVLEALAVVEMAKAAGLKIVVSHRSGETTDDFIVDFAVAASADYVKFGAPARGERIVKYNRLLKIEEQIKELGTTQTT